MEMSAWPTHDELDVANTLRQLAKLGPASDRRAGILRWGLRRKRSGPADEPPPPLPPPPQDREEPPTKLEEEIRKRNSSGGASTSPATPLSSFKTPARVMPPPTKLPSKALGQLHKQRVMEMSQMVATSSADNANLKRSLAETRSRFERLKETNSLLRSIRLKIMEMEERERRRSSDIVTSVGPIYINSLPVGPHHYAHQQLQHNPSWRDSVAPVLPQHKRGWAAASRMEGGGACRETVVPDLNASAEEAELQQSAMRAAMSAQARRRRIEIQREKSCYSYSLPPSAVASSASLAYKIPPRFR